MYADSYCREDKSQLNKLVEAVKTNFNERADEVRCYSSLFIIDFWLIALHLELLPRKRKTPEYWH